MLVGVQIPGAMPLAMLTMAFGQKTPSALPSQGLRCLWPLAMGLFAKGDEQYNQGQRPWLDAYRAVFANGDNQPVNTTVIVQSLFLPVEPSTRCAPLLSLRCTTNGINSAFSASLRFHLLLTTSNNSHIPFHVQVSGVTCACLPCHNRTKIQIGQKHRTQKMSVLSFCVRFFCHYRVSGEDLAQELEQVDAQMPETCMLLISLSGHDWRSFVVGILL